MHNYCKDFEISKEFSSARYSQSNGQAERLIGHAKNLIKRCKGNMDKVQQCLLDYHNTPLDSKLGSPANILMNRNLRGRIPCLDKHLITESDVKNRKSLVERQVKCKEYYDKTAKPVCKNNSKLKPGNKVVYRGGKEDRVWKQAKILSTSSTERSYSLVNDQGRVLTRNKKMLLPDKTGQDLVVIPELEPTPGPSHIPQTPTQTLTVRSPQPAKQFRPQPKPQVVLTRTPISPVISKELKFHSVVDKHSSGLRRSSRITSKPTKLDDFVT